MCPRACSHDTDQASPVAWINSAVQSAGPGNSCISVAGSPFPDTAPVWLPPCCAPATLHAFPQVSPPSVLCTCDPSTWCIPPTSCSPPHLSPPRFARLAPIHLVELDQMSPDVGPAPSYRLAPRACPPSHQQRRHTWNVQGPALRLYLC